MRKKLNNRQIKPQIESSQSSSFKKLTEKELKQVTGGCDTNDGIFGEADDLEYIQTLLEHKK